MRLPVGAEALEWQRILLGLPRVGVDTGARELPQETGQDYALHHTKGCYIGQEIVERIRARGQVPRRLAGLIVEGGAPARGQQDHGRRERDWRGHQQRGDYAGWRGADAWRWDM